MAIKNSPTISLLAVLAAACAVAVPEIHLRAQQPFEVRVHLRADHWMRSKVITADLKAETQHIWRPYGVRISWADAADAVDAESSNTFPVEAILSRWIGGSGPSHGTSVLGDASLASDGSITHPIRISLDATETVLALALRPTVRAWNIRSAHPHVLARALGRVLAHEIGHVLLAFPHHADAGLMRAMFPPVDLAEPDRLPFRLTCFGAGRLRNRIRALTGSEHQPIDRATCIPDRSTR